MRAWILGTAGWMPTVHRGTTSVLVRAGDRALLLDAGTGAARLVSEPGLLDGATRLDVLLTHFHLDHVCGLLYLPATGLPVEIHAPGEWLYGSASAQVLAPLLRAPVSPFASQPFAIRELDPGGGSIAGVPVALRAQLRHWAPTAGIRIGDALALVTDTAFDEGTAGFVAGVRHLLHEGLVDVARPCVRRWRRDGGAGGAGRSRGRRGPAHAPPPAPAGRSGGARA